VNDEEHRGPLDRLASAVPVDAFLRQVDVPALLDRVDVNALLDKIDVDRLIERIDLNEVLASIDLGDVIADSTKGVAAHTLEALRASLGRLDLGLEHSLDRFFRRRRTRLGPQRGAEVSA
jgi:hypothetical protein